MEIDVNALTAKILADYPDYNIVAAHNIAKELIETGHPSLEASLNAWINGLPLPSDVNEKYPVSTILEIRNNQNYIEAFRLYSRYKEDPEMGEMLIWKPSRQIHTGGL